MQITDEMVKAAAAEADAQDTAQLSPGTLERLSNDASLVWLEGYFDIRKILEAAAAAGR